MAVGVATSPLGFGDVTGADSVRTYQATHCREVPFRGRDSPWIRSKGRVVTSLHILKYVSVYASVFVCTQGAMQFLENYEKEDITVAELEGNSNSLWTISPPSKQKMIHELMDPNSSFSVVFSWSVQR